MEIETEVKKAMAKYPEAVKGYKSGKHGYVGLFVGEVMKASRNEADPEEVIELVRKMLS